MKVMYSEKTQITGFLVQWWGVNWPGGKGK